MSMQSAPIWKAPKIWDGSTCFILGGGPSLRDVDLVPIHNRRVIGVNNSYGDPVRNEKGELLHYEPRSWVDVCHYSDDNWFINHGKWLKNFAGLKVHTCIHPGLRLGCKMMQRGKQYGLEIRPGVLSWNGSSGGSAINLAAQFGCKRIILLGFDMKFGSDKLDSNWHIDHAHYKYRKAGHGNWKGWNPYPRFLAAFKHIQRDARIQGVEIVNATINSAIPEKFIPKVKLEDEL